MLPQVCLCLLMLIKCHGYQSSWNSDYSQHKIPQDVMVDVVNNLALKLLAIHNEDNANNIAISPYGALSVLIALGEGVRGSALYEIQRAANIPSDISVIRIGLRDIHRHLKSYFIPEEGFLSGLSLSHDNVTLNREYEDILKFYGYDINSFNNALYPDTDTTEIPETTTESTDTTPNTASTLGMEGKDETTTEMISTTTLNPTTTENSTDATTNTASTLEMEGKDAMTTETTSTTTLTPTTETEKITRSKSTVASTEVTEVTSTTSLPESTTKTEITSTSTNTPTTIESDRITRSESTVASTEVTEVTISMTSLPESTTKNSELTTEFTSTSTNTPTTESTTSAEVTTVGTTLLPESTTEDIESNTIAMESTATSTTYRIEATTAAITFSTTDLTTTESVPTTDKNQETTELGTSTIHDTNTETETTSTTEFSTTTGVGTTSETNSELGTSTITESTSTVTEETESSTETTSTTTLNNDSESTTFIIEFPPDETTTNPNDQETESRSTRSVVDYIIARYYDDHYITPRPSYESEKELYFLVNGKHREYNINYMTYDTVLPFYYMKHLNSLALRFPLDSTRYYLLLILPDHAEEIDKLICNLRLNTSLKHIIGNLRYTHVKAVIPSFMLKGYIILTSTFQKMGIRKAFEPRQADFSPMTSDRNIYVTNIEQAITVNIRNYVDPITMNSNRYLHQNHPVLFKADHPFLYFVIDSEIDVTLMAGKVINPLNSRIR